MLFVGSDTKSSHITMNSNSQAGTACSSDFVIYAPKTDIQMDSNVNYCGAIAGKTIEMNSNTTVTSNSAAAAFQLPGAGPHYVANRFVECSAATTSGTGTNC